MPDKTAMLKRISYTLGGILPHPVYGTSKPDILDPSPAIVSVASETDVAEETCRKGTDAKAPFSIYLAHPENIHGEN